MNVNQKLKNALSGMCNGNVWANTCPLENEPDEWLVYYPLYELPEDHGDDNDITWSHYMAIHWIKKGNCNYTAIRNDIRSRLKRAGFSVTQILPSYDSEAKSTHLIMYANIIEEDYDGSH